MTMLARTSKAVSFVKRLRWNAAAQRYHLPAGVEGAGRFLDPKQVRDAIENDIADQRDGLSLVGERLEKAASDFKAGKISEWDYYHVCATSREEVAQVLRDTHLAQTAAARGGFAQMDDAAYARASQELEYHIGKLNDFAMQWADPDLVLGNVSGRMDFRERLDLYADTALFTYESERIAAHQEQGYDEYRNVLHSENSCVGPIGCVEQAAKSWQKIGSLIAIGKRRCGPADLCTWAFRRSGA